MEKSPHGTNSKKDLLACVLNIFSAIPYSVAWIWPHQRLSLVKVPISSGRSLFGRARESKGRPVLFVDAIGLEPCAERGKSQLELLESQSMSADAEVDSEEAFYSKIATGPGNAHAISASENLRRLESSGHESVRLKIVRERGSCVFGELSTGHLLGGTGTVKEVVRKGF